jgi:hypothetical protein
MNVLEARLGRIAATLINQHVRRIEAALSDTRTAFFDLLKAIKDARDELGDEVFQSELAERLSISQGTLSKYLKIADCDPLIKNQKSLPPTLTTLYHLYQTHNTLVKAEGADKADITFKKLLEKITISSEANDVAPILKKAKERLRSVSKKQREKNLLSLSESSVSSSTLTSKIGNLTELIEANVKFRTIFIDPPSSLIGKACDQDFFASDIAAQYPVADLRAPSSSKTLQGFVYCPAFQIDGGLKILDACGFEFRDIIFPSKGTNGYELLKNERVLLRGERGVSSLRKLESGVDTGLIGALTIAEQIGFEPRLYVFASKPHEGWTCVK